MIPGIVAGTPAGSFSDPLWSAVLLLIEAIGLPDGSPITDQGPVGRTLVAVGNTKIEDEYLEFDGNEDWIAAADSSEWRFYNGESNLDFFIEFFGFIFDAAAGSGNGQAQPLVSQYDAFSPAAGQRGWAIGVNATNLFIDISTTGSSAVNVISYPFVPTLGQRYDIGIGRQGSTWRLFIDGALVASATQAGIIFDSDSPLTIGGRNTRASSTDSTDDLDGRIQAVRITRAARYTGDYTVPTLPLPRG